MHSKLIIGGLLASALVVPAFAQSTSPSAPSAPPAPPAATAPAPGAGAAMTTPASTSDLWRASKLIGLDIYNDQNEKLGDVSEVLVDKSGKVAGVVIGVGGFLGMGQHDIMVEMSKLRFVDEPVRTSATTTTTTTGSGAASPPASTTTTTARAPAKNWYPDHAVLSGASKDQLKAMPAFKFE